MPDLETSYVMTRAMNRRLFRAAHPAHAVLDVLLPLILLTGGRLTGLWGFALAAPFSVAVSVRGYRARLREVGLDSVMTLRLTATELETAWPQGSARRTWKSYSWARRRSGCWVLHVSGLKRVAFPVEALDEEQTRAFRAMLADNGVPVLGR